MGLVVGLGSSQTVAFTSQTTATEIPGFAFSVSVLCMGTKDSDESFQLGFPQAFFTVKLAAS